MAVISSGTVPAGDPVPVPSTAPGWMVKKDLAGLDDRALLGLVRLLPRASERRAAACELLVTRYQGLVRSCVRPYTRSPEPVEDLMQLGYVGLLKAISNFDPAAGGSLTAYAQPCISGELKRHFRDKRWHVHVKTPSAGAGTPSPRGDRAADPAAGPHAGRLRPGPAPGGQRG